jgi:Cu(I)/Ag(I) efflux system membrane fusion protein
VVRRRAGAPRPWDDDTFEVSFDTDNAPPAAAGWIVFAPRRQQVVIVPETALLPATDGYYVMVASRDDRTFTRRKVSVGRVTFGNVPIVAGLSAGERVATRRTFLLDAERRLGDPGVQQVEVDR